MFTFVSFLLILGVEWQVDEESYCEYGCGVSQYDVFNGLSSGGVSNYCPFNLNLLASI